MDDTITVNELKDAHASHTLIDIRKRPDAHQIPGSLRFDSDQLERASDLPFEKDEQLVVYCGSGNSCKRVAQSLRDKGYANARALEGGYKAWRDAELPLEEIGDIREF